MEKTTRSRPQKVNKMPNKTPDDCPFKNIIIPNPNTSQNPPSRQQEVIDNQMNTRVGKLEGVVETLTRDIQEVSRSVGVLGNNISDLKDVMSDSLSKMREGFNAQLETVTDRLTNSAKPQWQSISAFVVLAITVLGMAGAVVGLIMNGQANNINDLKIDANVISKQMFDNQYEKGKSDAFAAETSSHLTKLDITLQREMSLMQQTTDSKINSLEKHTSTYINDILDMAKEFRAWRLLHVTNTAELQGKLNAKQEMIEKRLEELDKRQYEYRTGRLSAFDRLQIDKTLGQSDDKK